MNRVRNIMRGRAWLMLAFAALVLVVRAVVPAGMMPRGDGISLTVAICGETAAGHRMLAVTVPRDHAPGEPAAGQDCAFAMLALAATDPGLPLLLIPAAAPPMLPARLAAPPAIRCVQRQVKPPPCGPPAFV